MEVAHTKKIKVCIKENVAGYMHEGKNYLPGEIVEIPEEAFCDWFMTIVEEPKLPKKTKEETVETEAIKEEGLSLSPPPMLSIKTRQRKKHS